jgi:tetratricopeptide (TPR) repeat protein
MTRRLPGHLGALLFLAISLVGSDAVMAQAKKGKKKAGGQSPAAADATVDVRQVPELPEVDFDVGSSSSPGTTKIEVKDETPDGRRRLREIEDRARTIFRERDGVMDKRRPFAINRDVLVGQTLQAQQAIVQADQQYKSLDADAADVRQQLAIAQGAQAAQLRAQLAAINASGAQFQATIRAQNAFIARLKPQIDALNIQVAPFDDRLQKLSQELAEARKQWLDLRQPQEKYTRGEYESLRRVLDDWLLIDGLWASAFQWAALCSYELQDYDKASDYLEKAQNLPEEARRSKNASAQLSALTALIYGKLPGQLEKARKAIVAALRDVDKKTGWETYFLVGRFYVDRERELLRAKANFETALKVKPNCLCAKLWLARLQTTAADDKIRDLKAGIKTLEYLWDTTGQRSWRLAFFLFEALHRSGRSADANLMWEKSLKLAPGERHEQLKNDRKMVMETT